MAAFLSSWSDGCLAPSAPEVSASSFKVDLFVDGSVLVEHCLAVPMFSPGNPDVLGDGNLSVDVGGI
eukprot:6258664-Prorocentrum_lima.AAC.1